LKVRDIKTWADEFAARSASDFEFSDPWHFNACRDKYPPFRGLPGVYVYSEPANPIWNVAFKDSDARVWYIGMSDTDVCGRIWDHVTPIYDPANRQPWVPRFAAHQWRNVEAVPEQIRNAIAGGECVVYVIRIAPGGPPPGRPRALEAYLLALFYAKNGGLPPLNTVI
jgi:hypothetical protein